MIPSPNRASIPTLLAYAGFLTALLYLLYFHLAADAPLHSNGNPPPGLARQRSLLDNIDGLMAAAAAGKNVEYHVLGSADDWTANGLFFATAYFSAVYSQYPARVLVGRDNAVINSTDDLQKADHVPPDSWLRQHQVTAVFNVLPGDQNGPQVLIHPVPN